MENSTAATSRPAIRCCEVVMIRADPVPPLVEKLGTLTGISLSSALYSRNREESPFLTPFPHRSPTKSTITRNNIDLFNYHVDIINILVYQYLEK